MSGTSLRVETVTDARALPGVRDEWESLHARAPRSDLFNSYGWAISWLGAFWASRPISFRFVYDAHELIGVVPLIHDDDGDFWCQGFLVTPSNRETPRMEPLSDGRMTDVMRALLDDESDNHRDVRIAFKNLPSDSPACTSLASLARTNSMLLVSKPDSSSPFIDTSSGWAEYLGSRKGKLRREMRRKTRAFARGTARGWRVLSAPEEVEEALAAVLSIERASWKEAARSSLTAVPATAAFYRTLATRLADRGSLRIYLLEADHRPIAHLFAAADRGVLYGLKTSYRTDYASCSPGTVLFGYVLEDAFARGFRVIDFLGANDKWKLPLSTGFRERQHLCLVSPGVLRCQSCHLLEMKAKPFVREHAPVLVQLKRQVRAHRQE